mmetsp:Transcript_30612/g.59030  ORF Transcript_30612/g.59030 Transcript_30612/m.59030 type:complete len:86 (+) Transcript_30612:151-408(+)
MRGMISREAISREVFAREALAQEGVGGVEPARMLLTMRVWLGTVRGRARKQMARQTHTGVGKAGESARKLMLRVACGKEEAVKPK